ncbi:hypothetical protein B0O80DRAFT_465006 [Mortierella sp. GBAus27b]|nr:hypothetical protein B0O80DRAFT_465006 [Mortierella sp. GBAus27b]
MGDRRKRTVRRGYNVIDMKNEKEASERASRGNGSIGITLNMEIEGVSRRPTPLPIPMSGPICPGFL